MFRNLKPVLLLVGVIALVAVPVYTANSKGKQLIHRSCGAYPQLIHIGIVRVDERGQIVPCTKPRNAS